MTETDNLEPAVRALIGRALASVEELEVLLWLLGRETPSSVAELQAGTVLAESAVVGALDVLVEHELVRCFAACTPISYALHVQNDQEARAITRLARAYAEHPLDVMLALSEHAIRRARRSALKMFSEPPLARPPKKDT